MKNILFLFLVSVLFVACVGNQKNISTKSKAESELDAISRAFIPDDRDDVRMLDLELKDKTVVLKGMTNRRDLYKAVKKTFAEKYTVADEILLLPDSELGKDTFAIVKNSVANLRSEPRHSAQLATQALMGMPLKIYFRQGDWYLIRTIENYIAWVDGGGIELMDAAELKEWQESERLIYQPISGVAYAEPEMKNELTDLVFGNVVQLIERGNSVRFRLPDNRIAYANVEDFLELDSWTQSARLTADNTLDIAHQLMGRPYLWGGTSVYGMDCSGYTKTIFLKQGIVIPRDASQQVKAGQKIELDNNLSNLIRGDLIFFGEKREDGSNRITHVAVYMGDGLMIHAAERVRIESLKPSDPLFNKMRFETMLEARRYIDADDMTGLTPLGKTMFYE